VLPLFDADGDGVIDYKEFADIIQKDDMCTRKVSVFLPFLQRNEMIRRITLSTKEQRSKRIDKRSRVASLLNKRRASLQQRFKKTSRPEKLYINTAEAEKKPAAQPASRVSSDDEPVTPNSPME
jgi:hypothetical protein